MIPIVAATCDIEASKLEPTSTIFAGISATAEEIAETMLEAMFPIAVPAATVSELIPFSKPESSISVPNIKVPSKAKFLTSQK